MTPIRRNALLLALGLVFQSGMIQLAVALGTVTIVAVTGVKGILGLGPAVFLAAGAFAVGPAGRASDRFGRMPVIRVGFVLGITGPLITAAGCAAVSATLVFFGLGMCGAAQTIVLLSRAAAAEMFPPERRARGMSIVLFGVVSRRDLGPARLRADVRRPRADPARARAAVDARRGCSRSRASRSRSASGPTRRRSPRSTAARPTTGAGRAAQARSFADPASPTAMIAAISSFAVMVGVMNLAGYVAVGHGHSHGSIFTIISLHIVGMYGLVLIIGDIVDRIGRRRSMVIGLALMALSNAGARVAPLGSPA